MEKRYVSVSLLTGKAKLTKWVGTEDEESFPIKAEKTHPYVVAYGTKYMLTKREIASLKRLKKAYEHENSAEWVIDISRISRWEKEEKQHGN